MDFKFNKGYLVYKNSSNGIVIVSPHSGPAFDFSTSRDDNSETVASICWRKLKGSLVVSNMPRIRLWGVDFNRDIPPINLALSMFKEYKTYENMEKVFEYDKKYAWVAQDTRDYENRLKIYQNFWAEVEKGKYIILIHRAFPRIKAIPSIMDFITFNSKGIKKELIDEIVKELNSKYYGFLKSIDQAYKRMIFFEEERMLANLIAVYKTFDLNKIKGEAADLLKKDLEKIKKYASKYVVKRLDEHFTPQVFLRAVEDALKNSPLPQITVENVFDGSLALGPKRKLFPTADKIIIEIEPSRFLNFWYPDTTANIIKDLVERIVK